jgi:predicted MFS family arabinose efflux permease
VFVTSGFGNFEFHNTHVKDNRATGLFMSGGVGTAVGNSVSLRMRVFLGCERARLFLPCAFLLALLTSVTATHPLILFTLHALATTMSYQG